MIKILESIISECGRREIPFKVIKISQEHPVYEIEGFSESKIAKIYVLKNKIICETKHNNLEEIDSFQDLAMISLEWFLKSKQRNLNEHLIKKWAEYWFELGIVKKEIQTIYKF